VPTPWISVVVPAYNEERGIAATVTALRDWLERNDTRPYEVIVVDNASEDRTAAEVEPLVDHERIQLLRNERNRGKGYSVRRGMLAAKGELCLHCDADCAPSLASLPAMLALLEDADVVVGSRLAPGAELGRRQHLGRRIVGRSFQMLCRAVLSEPTTDLYCGFKLWRGPVAEDVFTRIHLDGWTFDAEALAMARALGYRLTETGIVWTDREGSRLSMVRVLVPVTRELVAARRHIRREAQRPAAALTEAAAEPQG
jgi:dolichyl-phosphate beta-glucosyltransferase